MDDFARYSFLRNLRAELSSISGRQADHQHERKTKMVKRQRKGLYLRRIGRDDPSVDAASSNEYEAEVLNLRMLVAALVEKAGGNVLLTKGDLANAGTLAVWHVDDEETGGIRFVTGAPGSSSSRE